MIEYWTDVTAASYKFTGHKTFSNTRQTRHSLETGGSFWLTSYPGGGGVAVHPALPAHHLVILAPTPRKWTFHYMNM